MASDQLVTARDVLRAAAEVRRVGRGAVLRDWELREPDLAEHLMEGLSDLHRRVLALAAHPKQERGLMRAIETLLLVLMTALRRAQLRLWEEERQRAEPAAGDAEPLQPQGPSATRDEGGGPPHDQ